MRCQYVAAKFSLEDYQLVLFMLASERILYVMGSLYQKKSMGREFLIRPGF